MKSCLFVVNNTFSPHGLSGGDRIWIEFCRHWQNQIKLTILGPTSSIDLLKKYDRKTKIKIITTTTKTIYLKNDTFSLPFLFLHYLKRIFQALYLIFRRSSSFSHFDYVYSSSDFYPDFIPALAIKLMNPNTQWIAGYYLIAPSPFSKNSPYQGINRLKGILYFLSQKLSIFFVKKYADYVFITSLPDQQAFINPRLDKSKIIIIQGGVDNLPAQQYLLLKKHSKVNYQAVYLGRLHPQKGILELIDIWKIVVNHSPSAKLAVIGNGSLLAQVTQKITKLKLNSNVELLGFLDGAQKYRIFKQSKVVVHPAVFDSGGMAAAEAMAWGLPGVSFDLPALKTYYPKGMIKTSCFSHQQFADNILILLNNATLYHKYSNQARHLIHTHWSWTSRSQNIFNFIFSDDR